MTPISESDVNAAQQAWCDALIRIGAVHAEGGDYHAVASALIDELDLAATDRSHLLIKHVEGPLFFGFARGFSEITPSARAGKLLVLRMDRVSFMDQSGAYALLDAAVDLKSAGLRVLIVGLPVAQRDILEALQPCCRTSVLLVFDDCQKVPRFAS